MFSHARWSLPDSVEAEASRIACALGIHLPAARVLVRRGYTDAAAARSFLDASLDSCHDPFLMRGMDEAVTRLAEAVASRQPVLLYGDYDVDGITSVVILKLALEMAGGSASCHVPNRLREGYGMSVEAVERAAVLGHRLLVTADTGIRANKPVARARELGLDVVVTDHHLPDAELPPACAVINPKRIDCHYPEKNLCGAGVVFKLADALFQRLRWSPARRLKVLESFLKLVAIGTVADVVPLTGENRILVRHGLAGLRSTHNAGLRALLDSAGFAEGETPTAGQVAFRVAPRLNAAGRMSDASEAVELFLTKNAARARELAAQFNELNQERQRSESDILKAILDQCAATPVGPSDRALVFAGVDWHRGVVGIVASRLAERFHRPIVVLGIDSKTGLAHGSGRSIPEFHLLDALESMPGLFERFGGHRQAAGIALRVDKIPEFRCRLNERACERLAELDLIPILQVDAFVSLEELDDDSVDEVLRLEPFGYGNPAPVFALMGAELASTPAILKDKHLRFSVTQGHRNLTVIAWNAADCASELAVGESFDIAVTLGGDRYWKRSASSAWSATLKDFRPAGGL
jgi:single-stranded-DNA-specific exonuclease